MRSEIARLVDQVFRLVFIVRNVAHHRSLEPYKDEFEHNYWILVSNNFLDVAILEWCKAFGSRGDATHWSNNVLDPESFRAGMISRLGIAENEWNDYWENIKNYRDQVIAHHEYSRRVTHYPEMRHALTVCFYYYEILIQKLRALHVYDYPNDLEEYFERSFEQAQIFSTLAYQATKSLKENVY